MRITNWCCDELMLKANPIEGHLKKNVYFGDPKRLMSETIVSSYNLKIDVRAVTSESFNLMKAESE
ncbi:hypothetical protein OROMI_015718 [Orobanche minor]